MERRQLFAAAECRADNNANGAVTALVIRLTITWMMRPPTENFGSSREPEIGSLMSMTPREFLSSATASSTGSLVAVGLSTRGPNVELVEHQPVFRQTACGSRPDSGHRT